MPSLFSRDFLETKIHLRLAQGKEVPCPNDKQTTPPSLSSFLSQNLQSSTSTGQSSHFPEEIFRFHPILASTLSPPLVTQSPLFCARQNLNLSIFSLPAPHHSLTCSAAKQVKIAPPASLLCSLKARQVKIKFSLLSCSLQCTRLLSLISHHFELLICWPACFLPVFPRSL